MHREVSPAKTDMQGEDACNYQWRKGLDTVDSQAIESRCGCGRQSDGYKWLS